MKIKDSSSKVFLIGLIFIIFSVFFIFPINIFAASLDIPYFITIFAIDSNFQSTPIAYFDFMLKGGLKTNINLSFSFFYSDSLIFNVEDTDNNPHQIVPTFYLKALNATINNLFGFLDFSLFMNDFRNAGDGGSYNTFYYSMDANKTFESVYKISGYGVALKATFLNKMLSFSLFGYQPTTSLVGASTIDSLDLAIDLNLEDLSISVFAGTEAFVKYRWAVSIFFEKKIFSLLLTTGIEDTSTYDDLMSLYLLFEQNFLIENFYESFSVFSKPEIYNGQSLTTGGENTGILLRIDLGYKDKYNSFFAGLFTSLELRNYNLYSLNASPYVKLLSSGILWRIDVTFNLLDLSTIFSVIKLSFETAF